MGTGHYLTLLLSATQLVQAYQAFTNSACFPSMTEQTSSCRRSIEYSSTTTYYTRTTTRYAGITTITEGQATAQAAFAEYLSIPTGAPAVSRAHESSAQAERHTTTAVATTVPGRLGKRNQSYSCTIEVCNLQILLYTTITVIQPQMTVTVQETHTTSATVKSHASVSVTAAASVTQTAAATAPPAVSTTVISGASYYLVPFAPMATSHFCAQTGLASTATMASSTAKHSS
ncbi:hypothetical protein ANO11243_093160 [Dothideomycetidae sp. 11243]|nr:hypothetical protein ANO11243_093160 [fungal sp. No.11243]